MMKNDVKVFKLVCGEEIIASVIERISPSEENNLITLYRPCLLQGIDRSRSPQWILSPWIGQAKNEKLTISSKHIIFEGDPSIDAENNYLSLVSGLSL